MFSYSELPHVGTCQLCICPCLLKVNKALLSIYYTPGSVPSAGPLYLAHRPENGVFHPQFTGEESEAWGAVLCPRSHGCNVTAPLPTAPPDFISFTGLSSQFIFPHVCVQEGVYLDWPRFCILIRPCRSYSLLGPQCLEE